MRGDCQTRERTVSIPVDQRVQDRRPFRDRLVRRLSSVRRIPASLALLPRSREVVTCAFAERALRTFQPLRLRVGDLGWGRLLNNTGGFPQKNVLEQN